MFKAMSRLFVANQGNAIRTSVAHKCSQMLPVCSQVLEIQAAPGHRL